MPLLRRGRLKSRHDLVETNQALEHLERELVFGRAVDVDMLRKLLSAFIADCQRKLQQDNRVKESGQRELRAWILRWKLLSDELASGQGRLRYQVPNRISPPVEAPLPDPAVPAARPGYQSPLDIIRAKFGWPALKKPSETRLFNLEELPAYHPAPTTARNSSGG